MSNKLQPLRGTKDLLPDSFAVHEHIIKTAQTVGALYGYKPMSTPLIEYTRVFDRTLGDVSDIVSKEMYSFPDKSGESIALRPEFTAGIVRAVLSGGLQHKLPLKFFSYGPVFRYDRPQSGRQRQFHQINFEYIGASGAYTDAETIKLAVDILAALDILPYTTLEINSLGCLQSRELYQKKLVEYFSGYKDQLSELSLKRLYNNPLRILDSKEEDDKRLVANAPSVAESYTDLAREYFSNVLETLELLGIKYTINPKLVRGLDYYCHTAFEFTTGKLGSQSTVLAGGRYDGLTKIMGGPEIPAIGFAGGIERLALMKEFNVTEPGSLFIMPIAENNVKAAILLTDKLRQISKTTPIIPALSGKMNKRMQTALESGARYIVFIGDEEEASGNFKLKDLEARQESTVSFEQLKKLV